MANSNLTNAKRAKNDEFYTQYKDIEKEIQAYLDLNRHVFRDKVVYCNCDDPFESNFFKYFVLNFKELGLKQLITTSYKPSPIANTELVLQPSLLSDYKDKIVSKPAELRGRPKVTANKFIINQVHDVDGDGEFNLKDIAEQLKANKNNEWMPLQEDGDFRSPECVELLKISDIVVTNPPFSLFREYVKQLFDYSKKFVIIGSMNAIMYKEIFPLIKGDKMWLGNGFHAGNAYFSTPFAKEYGEGVYMPETGLVKFRNVCWFTNIDHGRRHQPLPLMTIEENLKYSKHKEIKGKEAYNKYDNYNAVEVSFTDSIPSDFSGVMGVPVSFLDKYSPEQFEIIGTSANGLISDEWKLPHFKKHNNPFIGTKPIYQRVFIKHKKK